MSVRGMYVSAQKWQVDELGDGHWMTASGHIKYDVTENKYLCVNCGSKRRKKVTSRQAQDTVGKMIRQRDKAMVTGTDKYQDRHIQGSGRVAIQTAKESITQLGYDVWRKGNTHHIVDHPVREDQHNEVLLRIRILHRVAC